MRDFQQSSAHSGGRLHGQLYRVLGLSAFQLNMIRSTDCSYSACYYFTIPNIAGETQILHFLHAEVKAASSSGGRGGQDGATGAV